MMFGVLVLHSYARFNALPPHREPRHDRFSAHPPRQTAAVTRDPALVLYANTPRGLLPAERAKTGEP